jgi:hypothetical protein
LISIVGSKNTSKFGIFRSFSLKFFQYYAKMHAEYASISLFECKSYFRFNIQTFSKNRGFSIVQINFKMSISSSKKFVYYNENMYTRPNTRIFKKFSKLAEILCQGIENTNLKEFFDFDHRKVPYEGYTPKMLQKLCISWIRVRQTIMRAIDSLTKKILVRSKILSKIDFYSQILTFCKLICTIENPNFLKKSVYWHENMSYAQKDSLDRFFCVILKKFQR